MNLSTSKRRSRLSRIVFHIDVNSAFLSWSALERLEQNPDSIDLRTIPSTVAGDVASRRGVVTAASILAKHLGVKSGEPVGAALRLCPNLILVTPNFSHYRRESVAFLEILSHHSPVVEQFSIDEAFLDMSTRFSDRRRRGAVIRACAVATQTEVQETLDFMINVGISESRLLARTTSDPEKLSKARTLWPGELSARFYPFPIRALFEVDGQSAEKLLRFGVRTIGKVVAIPCKTLQRILGPSTGKATYQNTRGISHSAVRQERPQAKSHSVEYATATGTEKRNAATELPPFLSELAEELSSHLEKTNAHAETLVTIAKTSSSRHHTRQQRLLVPGNEKEMLEAGAREPFSVLLEGGDGLPSRWKTLHLVGIGTTHLKDPQYQQLSLFSLPGAAEVRETKTYAATEAAEIEKRAAAAAAQAEKRKELGEMQAIISARYRNRALLRGGALLSTERDEISNTQIRSKQQGAEIKEP